MKSATNIKNGQKPILKKLVAIKTKGVLTLQELTSMGFSQATISRLAKQGKLLKQGRNLYYHPEAKINYEDLDFEVACKKFGDESVIAGLSALFKHKLIEQVPSQIWVIVDNRTQTSNKLYRLIRMNKQINIGILNNKKYKITNIERTIIEALKFSGKIGLRTALYAIRKALKEKRTSMKALAQMAKQLGYQNILNKYLEVISELINNE